MVLHKTPTMSVRQQLQWGPEKKVVQRISVDIVEAEIVGGDTV